ncbi:MAG TPA: PspA/IM30 family protein [Candidatus Acidoferrum sp.]|nr:PspA/IM30 family protein [Candidatus Acidoferrum sp.]
MARRPRQTDASCSLRLMPDAEQEAALDEFAAAYAALAEWLDRNIPQDHPADLVALHRGWYEAARLAGNLPSQTTTLALKDWAARRRGEALEGVPYDDKLYAARGVDQVSLTTLRGRIQVRCFVAGYSAGGPAPALARLVRTPLGWEFRIGVHGSVLGTRMKEMAMATEGVVARVGRVMAGMANSVVDMAEQGNPEAMLAQALREIDGAIDEVRTELGKARSEQIRVTARMKQLEAERGTLEQRIDTAIKSGRDDLAEAGIARQLDIEAQANLLAQLRAESEGEIHKLEASLDAIRASRREAEERLQDLRHTTTAAPDGVLMGGRDNRVDRANAKVERAMNAASRITGVPNGPAVQDAGVLQDLEALHRDNQIKERLAQLKAKRG